MGPTDIVLTATPTYRIQIQILPVSAAIRQISPLMLFVAKSFFSELYAIDTIPI